MKSVLIVSALAALVVAAPAPQRGRGGGGGYRGGRSMSNHSLHMSIVNLTNNS